MKLSAPIRAGMVGSVVAAAAGCLLAAAPAVAAPRVDVEEVVAALGLSSEPADYVVLVDTSGSMNQGGRYETVRRELRTMVGSLDSDDRVSLVTFDATAVPRFRGVVGGDPEAVVSRLPARAEGQRTDIGAAIAAGLTELQRPDTHRLAALILITDGKADTAEGSDYAKAGSKAWKKLRKRADALAERHQVAGYAVSLQSSTDAGLLKKVLPGASEIGAADVGRRFADLGGDLAKLQAARALEDELAQPITVEWFGDLSAAVSTRASVPLRLVFRSPYAHVPVELSDFTVRASDGVSVVLSGLPRSLSLPPGGTQTVEVGAVVSGRLGSAGSAELGATVSTPWSQVLTDDLGVEFGPALAATVEVPPAPLEIPPAAVASAGLLAGGLVVVAMLAWVAQALTTPRMDGVLTVRRAGRQLADIVVKGRRAKLVPPPAATELAGLTGSISGARAAVRGQKAVRLDARLGGERVRGVLAEGAVLVLGDLELAYSTERRRILDMIAVPRA